MGAFTSKPVVVPGDKVVLVVSPASRDVKKHLRKDAVEGALRRVGDLDVRVDKMYVAAGALHLEGRFERTQGTQRIVDRGVAVVDSEIADRLREVMDRASGAPVVISVRLQGNVNQPQKVPHR